MTTPIFYSPAYVGGGYAFETTRKAGWVAAALRARPIRGLRLVAPTPLTAAALTAVHSPAYVRAVRTGHDRGRAEAQGFTWDAGLWPMVCASNGGAVAAALAALQSGGVAGSLSSGLHHARRDEGAGFCTFNGLALAARAAVAAGAASVLILDLDAHGGGGTASLIADQPRIWQTDVSTCGFDTPTAGPRSTQHVVQLAEGEDYLGTIARALAAAPRTDLVLYNAGMDPIDSGVTRAELRDREEMVFSWAALRGTPIAFVLAGGYLGRGISATALAGLHRLTLEAAAA